MNETEDEKQALLQAIEKWLQQKQQAQDKQQKQSTGGI